MLNWAVCWICVGVTSAASWTADTPGTGAETCRNSAQLRPLCPKSFWEKEKRLVFSRRTAVLFHMGAYGDLLSTLCRKHDETWPRSRHKHRKRIPRVVQRLNRLLPGTALNISSVRCYFMLLLLFLHLVIALEQLLGFIYNIFLFLIFGAYCQTHYTVCSFYVCDMTLYLILSARWQCCAAV